MAELTLESVNNLIAEAVKPLAEKIEALEKANASSPSAVVANQNDDPVELPKDAKEVKVGKETVKALAIHPSIYFAGKTYTAQEVMENDSLIVELIKADSPSIAIQK